DPRTDVDREPGELVAVDLALSRVDAGPDLQAESRHRVDDGTRTTDRARRTVECRQEPVACGVDLTTAEADELAPHGRMVGLEQLAPAAVAELARLLGRPDEVGEENRREHALGIGRLALAGQELPDPRERAFR